MIQLMNWAGTETIQAEELTVLPGLDEIFALIDVKTHVESGRYDVLIVDCAPTAETLRLLSLPDVMQWYIERIFPVERKIVKTVRPLVSRVTTLPIAGERVFDAVERLHRNLDAVKRILTDETTSSVRLVVNPEKMVIAEARRTYTYLGLFGYRVDAVVVNRVLPPDVTDPYFGKWKDIQAEHIATVHESFEPVPILSARLFDRDGRRTAPGRDGERGVRDLAATDILYHDEPIRVRKRASDYVLMMAAVRLSGGHGYPSARRERRVGTATLRQPDPAANVEADDGPGGELRRRPSRDPVRTGAPPGGKELTDGGGRQGWSVPRRDDPETARTDATSARSGSARSASP